MSDEGTLTIETEKEEIVIPEAEMTAEVLPIVLYPEEGLKQQAEKVTEFDDELKQLILNMFYTMRNAGGIGLAAPQVGVNKQVIVMNINEPLILVNPVILESSGETEFEEGCLSVPGYFAKVKRAEQVRIIYQNEEGEDQELIADGLNAICIQHEIDHLMGKVFVDYLSKFRQLRAKRKVEKTIKGR